MNSRGLWSFFIGKLYLFLAYIVIGGTFMINISFLQQLLVIGIALSTITCAFVQKTKRIFRKSKYLTYYSFILNLLMSIAFCDTFTTISFPISLWVGLFSFLGADTIYKSLEGRISSYRDIVSSDTVQIKKENVINVAGDN